MLIVGCGGESDRATSTTDAATTVAPPNLEQLPPASRRGPGPGTDVVAADRLGAAVRPPARKTAPSGSSAVATSRRPTSPPKATRSGGVSSVLLFETEAGARDWMAYETSDEALRHQMPSSKIERFQVPDVPGAHGWTGPDLHGNAIGQVYWTQGRCMMTIAIEVEGPRVEPLSAAAKSIYERTGGTCPD